MESTGLNAESAQSELAVARAALFELLSMAFSYPAKENAERIVQGEWGRAVQELCQSLDFDCAPVCEALEGYEDKSPDECLHLLRVEYTRLFIGEGEPLVSPYEGLWRSEKDDDQVLFVNPFALDVEKRMKACGFGLSVDVVEPADHVACECAFAQCLELLAAGAVQPPDAGEDQSVAWGQERAAFMVDHMAKWVSPFCDAVERYASEPFYLAHAALLRFAVELGASAAESC